MCSHWTVSRPSAPSLPFLIWCISFWEPRQPRPLPFGSAGIYPARQLGATLLLFSSRVGLAPSPDRTAERFQDPAKGKTAATPPPLRADVSSTGAAGQVPSAPADQIQAPGDHLPRGPAIPGGRAGAGSRGGGLPAAESRLESGRSARRAEESWGRGRGAGSAEAGTAVRVS